MEIEQPNSQVTKYLPLYRHDPQEREYFLGQNQLEKTNLERDLGVIMDSGLTFNQHVLEKAKKANTILAVIRQSFTYLDDQTFILLYNPTLNIATRFGTPS